jgi:kynureninase
VPSEPITTREQAVAADGSDVLAAVRDKFSLPPGVRYLDGNSLGALPACVPAAVADAVTRQWGRDLITSWNDNEWWTLPGRVGDRIGALVGAAPGQVMCGDSTTIQLHQAITAAARRTPSRSEMLTDDGNFPTDRYVAGAVGAQLGVDVRAIHPSDAVRVLQLFGDEIGAVALSAVDYRTGELYDLAGITAAAHEAGATVVWDLAHAAGAVPVDLDGLGADFAVGCSYKYLNGGPGAPAWIYVAQQHQATTELPIVGWHGHEDPFGLHEDYIAGTGIDRTRLGTPPLLSMLALEAALTVWEGVDLNAVRAKSLALTDLVIAFADRELTAHGVEVVTPRAHGRRGSQVSLRMPNAYEVCQALITRQVIGDFRAPDLLRLGFTPLYLSYVEAWDAMTELADVLSTGAWRDPAFAVRATVT